MGMTPCPTCQRSVSTEAAACPGCGHQFKAAGGINLRDPVHALGVVLISFFLIVVVGVAYLSAR